MLINEFRSGKLGRISLETPEMVEREKLAIAEAKARKEAENAERKQRFKDGSRNSDRADRKEQKNLPKPPRQRGLGKATKKT